MEINKYINLTINDCLQVLQNSRDDQEYREESISFDMKPLSDTPQGFGGEHFIITISYKTTADDETKNQRFFLKNMNDHSEIIKTISESLNAYKKEAFIYSTFMKECRTMGIDVSFAPEGYYTRPHFLILEDVSQAGYRTGDKFQVLTFGQCRAVLDALAKFHMSVVVYEYEKRRSNIGYSLASEDADLVLERREKNGKLNVVERWIQATMDGLVATIHLAADDDCNVGIDRDEFKRRLKSYVASEEFYDDLKPKEGDLCCLLHNDLWCNNFMFLHPPAVDDSEDNGSNPVDCKLIDYQILSYGSPAVDVMRAIYTNTSQKTRDEHKEELLRHYFRKTVEYLGNHGLGPDTFSNWTWDIFSATCDRVELVVKLRTTAARSLTFLPSDVAAKRYQHPDAMDRLLFTDRMAIMQESYTLQTDQGELYRSVIGEDVRELRKLFTKRKA